MDLVPEIKIIVHREGEALEEAVKEEKATVVEKPAAEVAAEELPVAEETAVEEVPASESEAAAVDKASETTEE
jgi:hypothetical protein